MCYHEASLPVISHTPGSNEQLDYRRIKLMKHKKKAQTMLRFSLKFRRF
ncbi:hypothetical protein B932_0050 [Gluconobacter oxydans H24]|nr:hypothetical protein B932_0050 [Gluconobacter oxydans H24]